MFGLGECLTFIPDQVVVVLKRAKTGVSGFSSHLNGLAVRHAVLHDIRLQSADTTTTTSSSSSSGGGGGPMVTPSLLGCSSLAALVCARAPPPLFDGTQTQSQNAPDALQDLDQQRLGGLGISYLAREVMAHASAGSQSHRKQMMLVNT